MPHSIGVSFEPLGIHVHVPVGSRALDACKKAGLVLSATCGGVGTCGGCQVRVINGATSPPSREERAELGQGKLDLGDRLACSVRLQSDAVLSISPRFLVGRAKLLLESHETCSLADEPQPQNKGTRLPASDDVSAYGVAIDLGCTKIAVYLVELESGDQIGSIGVVNPQIAYGEDLIARLVFADKSTENADELAECVRTALAELVDQLLTAQGVSPGRVSRLSLVGNPAMTHLLMKWPVSGLIAFPFHPHTTSAVDIRAGQIGVDLPLNPNVHILPAIDAFVGADLVAVVLANELHKGTTPALGVDLGTNTEVILSDPVRSLLFATSCPAGPAFEGGHLTQGMRAMPGAIERVIQKNGQLVVTTIAGEPALGLCGSGAVDAIAMMWQSGVIDEYGHLLFGKPGVRQGKDGLEYVLVADDSSLFGEVVITQRDVSEIQLAKAAVSASIETLLEVAGLDKADIAKCVLAGAFGNYLRVESARAIGLLPDLPAAQFLQAGNSAGKGAKLALLSARLREDAVRIAQNAKHIDLKKQVSFNRHLAYATRFESSDRH
jgi:uncharacterized 2Fe-2S/4Fe-4S cluster protein (DUF4445 family)